jgi:hypothetical protein
LAADFLAFGYTGGASRLRLFLVKPHAELSLILINRIPEIAYYFQVPAYNCCLELGMAPDTCTAEIIVFDNPDGIMEGDTTICSGDCAPISVLFSSGTPPFTYQVDDRFFINVYSSSTSFDTFFVCPQVSTTYTLLSITDAFGCTVSGQFNDVTIDVVSGVSASITQNGDMLCANPPNQNYQWWDCGYNQLQSISQCLTLTQNNCYCLIVADAVTSCVDTICGILPSHAR